MKIKFGDIVIALLILVIAVLILLSIRSSGETVVVEVDGKVVATFDLNESTEYEYNAEYTNVITIKNKKAYVSYSDCPDNTCVHSGKLDSSGRVICCLPNRLVLRIKKGINRMDVISG